MSNRQVGANEREIEITPEMVEAGTSELLEYDKADDSAEAFVEFIYQAMERTRLCTISHKELSE